jgi:hypothetical protein
MRNKEAQRKIKERMQGFSEDKQSSKESKHNPVFLPSEKQSKL